MQSSARRLQKEKTRADILRVAKRLFLRDGYERTTTRGIAEAAGVGTGTVFVHFADKRQLVRALLQGEIDEVLGTAVAGLATAAGGVDALLHYARHLYEYYRSQWDLSRALLRDSLFDAADHREQVAAFVAELAARLAADAPELAVKDRTILARCLVANYLAVLVEGLSQPGSPLVDWLDDLEARCRLLVRPYRRRAATRGTTVSRPASTSARARPALRAHGSKECA